MESKPPLTILSHPVPTRPRLFISQDIFEFQHKQYLVTVDYCSDFYELDQLINTQSTTIVVPTKAHFAHPGIPVSCLIDDILRAKEVYWLRTLLESGLTECNLTRALHILSALLLEHFSSFSWYYLIITEQWVTLICLRLRRHYLSIFAYVSIYIYFFWRGGMSCHRCVTRTWLHHILKFPYQRVLGGENKLIHNVCPRVYSSYI